MIATNEETLAELFTTAIIAIAPRLTYKGAEGWKPYNREVDGASRTRRFRLVWPPGATGLQPRGTSAGDIFEHFAELRVRTDYAGEHAKQQHLIIDDFHQLADTLSATKAGNNGVVLVERLRTAPVVGGESDDVVKVDHIFTVRYMRRIQL
jgi:hypothetical protein